MSFTVREYLSGHQLPNQDASYIRTSEEDRLAEFVKAIPLLTIDPTQKLRQENAELRKDYLAELGDLREEFNEMKMMLGELGKFGNLGKGRLKKLVGEFVQRTGDELHDQWWSLRMQNRRRSSSRFLD